MADMGKLTRFQDVPQLISSGQWECGFQIKSIAKQLNEWVRDYGLDLDPDFQRIHVWTGAQQTAWMEYLLRGGRTGRTVYFNAYEWARGPHDKGMVLVDGKQRLEALRRFFANEIRAFGAYFREFTDEPDMLRGGLMLFNVHDLPRRAQVLQWYCEMNGGGTPHTDAEIERVRDLLARESAMPIRATQTEDQPAKACQKGSL